MTISFIWYFKEASKFKDNWRDGLRGAIELISKKHTVDWFLDETVPEDNYDFYLFWGDSHCPFFDKLDQYKGKKGICLSTMPQNFDNLRKLDVVYCESQPVYEAVRAQGIRAILAFGTDTDFYTPTETTKDIPYFYPATYSPWKRQSALAPLMSDLWCVGTLQPDGQGELNAVANAGAHIEIGYLPPEKIRGYYNRAVHVPIPAIHGSERTCLEAMSMNILPEVNPDNFKTYSYIDEYKKSGYKTPRDFVVDNYSHYIYAERLLRGME